MTETTKSEGAKGKATRFDNLDLNLLVTLDALLQECNVTRAAQRVGLTQSATSSALARLRTYYGDELLTLNGRRLVPTLLGSQLAPAINEILADIRGRVSRPLPFCPQSFEGMVRVMAGDDIMDSVIGPLACGLAQNAPNLRLELSPLSEDIAGSLEKHQADMAIVHGNALVLDLPSKALFEDDFVVIGWAENEDLGKICDVDSFINVSHVSVSLARQSVSNFDRWLRRAHGVDRRVQVKAFNFLSLPSLLIGTRRVAVIPRRLAQSFSLRWPLRYVDMPFEVPEIIFHAQWRSSNVNDPLLNFILDELRGICRI